MGFVFAFAFEGPVTGAVGVGEFGLPVDLADPAVGFEVEADGHGVGGANGVERGHSGECEVDGALQGVEGGGELIVFGEGVGGRAGGVEPGELVGRAIPGDAVILIAITVPDRHADGRFGVEGIDDGDGGVVVEQGPAPVACADGGGPASGVGCVEVEADLELRRQVRLGFVDEENLGPGDGVHVAGGLVGVGAEEELAFVVGHGRLRQSGVVSRRLMAAGRTSPPRASTRVWAE